MNLKSQIDLNNIPAHIAIIMDGNGRWAKKNNRPRIFGHRAGVKTVRRITESCTELGVKHLTVYAFSTENWNRPKTEVSALMTLLIQSIKSETKALMKNQIRLKTIGNSDGLPEGVCKSLMETIEETSQNSRLDLILALNYSSKWEIANCCKKIAKDAVDGKIKPENINEELVSSYLSTTGIPDPELLIRTSGEQRISNFLLWQIAYSELYFTETLWPDFNSENLYEAILSYQKRERRFGKISEQLQV